MKNIPEGYTYVRCDQYTPAEFRSLWVDSNGYVSRYCKEYMFRNPKEMYNTDDEIGVRRLMEENRVGSIYELTGRATTKRYRYDEV